MLHVLPSMGSVTNYALSWDANLKTIQQCQLEALRETDGMVSTEYSVVGQNRTEQNMPRGPSHSQTRQLV